MAENDYAILVGINKYAALSDLDGPVYDVKDFGNWLASPEGGQVPEGNITLIISPSNPSWSNPLNATPQEHEVDRAFTELYLKGQGRNGKVGQRLYIYMAGHGFSPELKDTALLMANAACGLSGYHVQGRPYAEWFERSRFFDEVVLIMDCCRENYNHAPKREPPFDQITNVTGTGRYFYGFAAEWSRSAREKPVGPNNEKRGIFTAAVLAGLKTAPPDNKGNITGASLARFVFNYMDKLCKGDDERQEPEFLFDVNRDIVFKTGVTTSKFSVRLTLSPANFGKTPRLFDGTLTEIVGNEVNTNIWMWEGLPSGMYKLQVPDIPAKYLELIGEERIQDVTL